MFAKNQRSETIASSRSRFALSTVLGVLLIGALAGCSSEPPAFSSEPDGTVLPDGDPSDLAEIIEDSDQSCIDDDGDSHGEGCEAGPDCDDGNPYVYEGATEICDGLNNDCDDAVDEGCPCAEGDIMSCYTGPGETLDVGRCRAGWQMCEDEEWGSCQDQVIPSDESCDGMDNDCDGLVDEELINACGRCGPVPPEICMDGLDNDCDGLFDESDAGCDCDDRTHQPCYSGPPHTLGVGECQGGYADCDGEDWGRCRGEVVPSEEICDELDNDCDGLIDEGLLNDCGVCGEPTPEEVCDGVDNDCDGLVDEYLTLTCGECAGDQLEEICGNAFDDDCDGKVDEACPCEGPTECYPGPPELAGIGACEVGERECDSTGEFWGPCLGYVLPQPEVCDGVDNDCDNSIDTSPLGCDLCGPNIEECNGEDDDCDGFVDEYVTNACGVCLDEVVPEESCGAECCDGLDNDCDGLIDEGLLNACGTCGDSCYIDRFEPSPGDDIGEGGELIAGDDPDNPTDRPGVTLSQRTVFPPYLWAANHDNDTVSRFNTDTLREEGRYWVGDNPSRTGVDLDGNVWVGGRQDGRLTKILWDTESCPDRNDNGVIDTATFDNLGPLNSAANPMADECIVYSAVPYPDRDSIRGSAAAPDGTVWIGYSTGGIQPIDPYTFELGAFVDQYGAPLFAPDAGGVQQPVMNGDTQQTGNTGGVYGVVVDARGHLYTSSYNRNTLARFDTNTGEWIALYTGYVCGSYGVAVDAQNRVWTGGWPGCRGIGMFDPETNRFHNFAIPTTTTMSHLGTSGVDPNPASGCGSPNYCVTGVAAEPATGNIWASFYNAGYTGRLIVNDADYTASQWTFIGTLFDYEGAGARLPGMSSNDLRGIGFDAEGYGWTLGLSSGRVWKLDPATNARSTDMPTGMTIGIGSHYTYSDFTGSTALSFTSPRTYWRYIFDSGYPNSQPDRVVWEAYAPPSTSVGIRVRMVDGSGTPTSAWVPAPGGDGTVNYDPYPTSADSATFDVLEHHLAGQRVEIEVQLSTTDPDVKPIVHRVDLYWQRP